MRKNKIMKAFFMLVTVFTITIGMTGCGGSPSLSNREVKEKIETLASEYRDQMGYNVSVQRVKGRSTGLFLFLVQTFSDRLPNCEEMWLAEFHSDKWTTCVVRLCRSGSYYFLDFNE